MRPLMVPSSMVWFSSCPPPLISPCLKLVHLCHRRLTPPPPPNLNPNPYPSMKTSFPISPSRISHLQPPPPLILQLRLLFPLQLLPHRLPPRISSRLPFLLASPPARRNGPSGLATPEKQRAPPPPCRKTSITSPIPFVTNLLLLLAPPAPQQSSWRLLRSRLQTNHLLFHMI